MHATLPESMSRAHTGCSAPRVSVIVVNYNGMAHIDECLSALLGQSYPSCQLIVVDNCSSDGSLTHVQRNYPAVELLASDQNLGYSGAVNAALPYITGHYVAVLNMDAIVDPDWLRPLVALLEANPRAGAVTPKIVLHNQPDTINALGQNIHISALGFNRSLHHLDQPEVTAPFRVSGLHGAAFLLRRDLLERMGGMNAACFLYHEDVDLSWLIQLMGYDIYCVPAATVRHKYVLKMDPQKLFYLERNRMMLLLSNLRFTTLLAILPFLLLTECMMAAYCVSRGSSYIGAKARSLRWVWRQRTWISRRRRQVQGLRQRSDWQLLARLHIGYEWDQLLTLGRAPKSARPRLTA